MPHRSTSAPTWGRGTRVGPAGTGPHITWENITAGGGKEVIRITFEFSTHSYQHKYILLAHFILCLSGFTRQLRILNSWEKKVKSRICAHFMPT